MARRTPSVNTFSSTSSATQVMQPPAAYRTSPTQDVSSLRRTPSSATGSTAVPSSSAALGSSPSQQAGGSSVSYVALLRRQKATVWCDRSQTQDPRLAQAQRQAKMRAALEVLGASGMSGGAYHHGMSPSLLSSSLAAAAAAGNSASHPGGFIPGATGRTGSGISSGAGKVAAKIRHHGKPGVVGYGGGLLGGGLGGELGSGTAYVGGVGGGVPLRLSATEVEDGEDDDDESGAGGGGVTRTVSGGFAGRTGSLGGRHHSRTGSSGRSSMASLGRRATGEWHRSSGSLGGHRPQQQQQYGRWGSGSGPATPERTGSLVVTMTAPSPTTERASGEPFPTLSSTSSAAAAGETAAGRAKSTGSGRSGSSERHDAVGELTAATGSMSLQPSAAADKKQSMDDLKRRGSVDERTMTLTHGKLFIANPD